MSENQSKPASYINRPYYVVAFVLALSAFSGILLSTVYYFLAPKQQEAALLNKNEQMLMAAHVLNDQRVFQLYENKQWVPAIYDTQTQLLLPAEKEIKTSSSALNQYIKHFVHPLLTDTKGNIFTFEEKQLTLADFEETISNQSLFLFYAVLKNDKRFSTYSPEQIAKDSRSIQAIILPISGFGLWGPLHGFLGIANDGNTVLGAAWYQQVETPGLGANITNPQWLKQFYGKHVFATSNSNQIDFRSATLGLKVLKGSVDSNLGNSPLAYSSIDGISGATLTGNGVTEAYTHSLEPYRYLLISFAQRNRFGV